MTYLNLYPESYFYEVDQKYVNFIFKMYFKDG